MSGRSRAIGVLVGAILAVALPGGAFAGEEPDPNVGDTVVGTVGGVRYAKESAPFAAVGGYAAATAGCGGASWHIVGGGGSTNGLPADTWQESQSFRDFTDADLRPDDGFEASGFGQSGSRITAWSMCLKDTPTRYVVTRVPDQASGRRSGSAACGPAKWHVTSGGVFIATTDSWIGSGRPTDGGDADTRPDDAWQGTAYDTIGGAGGFAVYAVCVRGLPLSHVTGAAADVAAGGSRSRTATCPAGTHVVGGGVRTTGPVEDARLVSSGPFDGPDADAIPDDGWKVTVHDVSANAHRVTAYAVCLG